MQQPAAYELSRAHAKGHPDPLPSRRFPHAGGQPIIVHDEGPRLPSKASALRPMPLFGDSPPLVEAAVSRAHPVGSLSSSSRSPEPSRSPAPAAVGKATAASPPGVQSGDHSRGSSQAGSPSSIPSMPSAGANYPVRLSDVRFRGNDENSSNASPLDSKAWTQMWDEVDSESGIPSDEIGRPKPPHSSKVPPQCILAEADDEELGQLPLQALRDEQEWLERKRLTGTVARLVRYKEGQRPADDIQGLCLTRQGRIMVTALALDGPAAKAGVTPGDQLASINGKQFTVTRPANAIIANVVAPVTLIFLGFAGKLQAEVRVRQPDQPRCGLPGGTDLSRGKAMTFAEAVVFEKKAASLFIVTEPPPQEQLVAAAEIVDEEGNAYFEDVKFRPSAGVGSSLTATLGGSEGSGPTETKAGASLPQQFRAAAAPHEREEAVGPDTSVAISAVPKNAQNVALFELQREDARRVLRKALKVSLHETSLCEI